MTLRHTKARHTVHLRANKQIHCIYVSHYKNENLAYNENEELPVAAPQQHTTRVSSRTIKQTDVSNCKTLL